LEKSQPDEAKFQWGIFTPSLGGVTLFKTGVTVTRLITLRGLVWRKIITASYDIENYTFLSFSFKHKHTQSY
jgi:hypothetical protein